MNNLVTSLSILFLNNIRKTLLLISFLTLKSQNKSQAFVLLCVIFSVLKLSSSTLLSKTKNFLKRVLNRNNDNNDKNDNIFVLNINQVNCGTPIFNLKTYKDLDYYYNFLIDNYDTKKINNLIMCRDIHKWMNTSSLSEDDLKNEHFPIYFVKKQNNIKEQYEYIKISIYTDKNNIKNVNVEKGSDYLIIENNIKELINKNLIKDLLIPGKYNLSLRDDTYDYLDKFLSLLLIPEHLIGETMTIDIGNYNENKKKYEYNFNTINSDINLFNTSI